MATTTSAAFDEFHNRIKLTAIQSLTVQQRRTTVTDYLQSAFGASSNMPLNRTWVIGSAQRGTMIRPLNDIDMMASFSNAGSAYQRYQGDSRDFLYRVRDALNKVAKVKVVGARGQAVRFFYTDGLHVDVVPVFKWSTDGYALPSGDGKWLTTDPDEHHRYLNAKAKELGGDLKQFSRAMKQWNRAHSSRLKAFHLEVLVPGAFSHLGNDTGAAAEIFFKSARKNLSVPDPAGHSDDLASYLGWYQRGEVKSSLERAEDQARRANSAEANGNHKKAIGIWGTVFGDEFPAHG